jgi:hypothetical protein
MPYVVAYPVAQNPDTFTVLNGVFLPVLRSTILLTNTGTSIVFVCLS